MIVLDYKDRRPLYEQITEKLEMLILKGALPPDSKLPSVRQMAMELSINPNTIQRAYAQLEQQGYIYPVKGRGNFVSPDLQIREREKSQFKVTLKKILLQGISMGVKEEETISYVKEIYKGAEQT